MNRVDELIRFYDLVPHPEGGFFREMYRSSQLIQTEYGMRCASTAIMFLITRDSISHFHKLRSDEGWHFHDGAPLRLLEIGPDGVLKEIIMGQDISSGHKLQYVVPAGHWFASTSTGDFSLVGCTVAPGFEFADFEMGKRNELSKEFPKHSEVFEKYCLD